MDFTMSDERRMLADSLRRTIERQYGPEARAKADDTGSDPAVWAALAELGVLGALFTEEQGGFGGAGPDIATVFEELGRAAVAEPVTEALLAGGILADCGKSDAVEQLIAGDMHLCLAQTEPGNRYDLTTVSTQATESGGAWALTGHKSVVVNAPAANLIVVTARVAGDVGDRDGIGLFTVAANAKGLAMRPYPMIGGGRGAEVTLDATPAERIGPDDTAAPILERHVARAILAQCAEAVGMMDAIRDMTLDYLRTRKQFGRPIGSFQALQHRMADMAIEIEQARSAVLNLAGHVDEEPALRDRHASAAKQLIGRAARLVVEDSVQLHGGIGMTAEYGLGHLVRRLMAVDHRFGDTDHHLERFIALRIGAEAG
ncbi:acyl-CoA dehydrogenase [Pararhodobacter sp. SW119]|uniref:acyl-CoA dehydrogenase family protein n=1 Tax=Pararhodobacter sp. SW119 TaxID=2780075 RepID=UPI001ADEDD1F|nr:acyl-CoA dehydrogenase [Pararhodobacter sp. SW119]